MRYFVIATRDHLNQSIRFSKHHTRNNLLPLPCIRDADAIVEITESAYNTTAGSEPESFFYLIEAGSFPRKIYAKRPSVNPKIIEVIKCRIKHLSDVELHEHLKLITQLPTWSILNRDIIDSITEGGTDIINQIQDSVKSNELLGDIIEGIAANTDPIEPKVTRRSGNAVPAKGIQMSSRSVIKPDPTLDLDLPLLSLRYDTMWYNADFDGDRLSYSNIEKTIIRSKSMNRKDRRILRRLSKKYNTIEPVKSATYFLDKLFEVCTINNVKYKVNRDELTYITFEDSTLSMDKLYEIMQYPNFSVPVIISKQKRKGE